MQRWPPCNLAWETPMRYNPFTIKYNTQVGQWVGKTIKTSIMLGISGWIYFLWIDIYCIDIWSESLCFSPPPPYRKRWKVSLLSDLKGFPRILLVISLYASPHILPVNRVQRLSPHPPCDHSLKDFPTSSLWSASKGFPHTLPMIIVQRLSPHPHCDQSPKVVPISSLWSETKGFPNILPVIRVQRFPPHPPCDQSLCFFPPPPCDQNP